MNKKLGFIVVLLLLTVPMVIAAPNDGTAAYNLLKKGETQLMLYEKDAEWNVVEGGAWGKLHIKKNNDFIFQGHGLDEGVDYSLIVYDDWGLPVVVLGSATATVCGTVVIKGEYTPNAGDKVWLVLSADIVSDTMAAWNPSEYLFEYDVF